MDKKQMTKEEYEAYKENIRILLVEDDKIDQMAFKRFVKDANLSYSYAMAGSVSEAKAILDSQRFDIVIMDYSLGDGTALDIFDLINDTPIIIVTGSGDEETAVKAMKAGAYDYIIKDLERNYLKVLPITVESAIKHKRTEKQVGMLSHAIMNINDSIYITDMDDRIIFVNKAFCETYEYEEADIVGMDSNILGESGWKGEFYHRREDRSDFPISLSRSVVKDENGNEVAVVGVSRDITERKRAEKVLQEAHDELERRVEKRTAELREANELLMQENTERKRAEALLIKQKGEIEKAHAHLRETTQMLVQAEKMSAVGTMVAGVSHELNNPMMGILNFIQYCLKHTSSEDKRYGVLQDAERETNRCIDIVKNLLTFSRMEKEGPEARQKGSCAVVFDRVLKLLSYRIEKQGVLITHHTAEGTPEIWMKVNNIQQVFLNLIGNALDALKDREKKEIHVDIRREGEFVPVTVADTGCGISPENIQKIFDPFFTTKPAGDGTGLGLSVCRGIIKEHGGEISCESKIGVGTRFKILLPIEKDRRKEGRKENEQAYFSD
jgi:signal transduction histidine kinase/ActR/RegA family two-component response regulator